MNVASWYDQGSRLTVDKPVEAQATVTVESWYDNGVRINLPVGLSARACAASPQLAEKVLAYETDVAAMQAQMAAWEGKEGTMKSACASP